ncbi:Arginine-glutamic acid dipeptide repeats protein [Echinococcus granulosus]|nr:Arginine-glutamic acid dipeptide repeats protein [Echinococcus granulosus]
MDSVGSGPFVTLQVDGRIEKMATDAINTLEAVPTTGDDEPVKPSLTAEETIMDSHQNNDSSTPEPVKELPLRRSNRGKGRSDRVNHGDERVQSCVFATVEYKPSDYVYFEEADSDCYAIGIIDEIKLSRREKCTLVVKYFWRTFDVPEVSKQALLDRESADKGDSRILARELFITDLQTSIDSTLLRGKCSVAQFPELINALESFDPNVEDSFYYVYAFNPESKRLLSIRAEIKIGPAYQATWLPPYRGTHPITHRCDKHNSVLNRLRETQNTAAEVLLRKSLKRQHCCLEASRTSTSHCEHVCLLRVEESPPKQWEELIWHPEGLETSLPFREEAEEAEGDAESEGIRGDFTDRRLKTYLDAVRSLVAIFAFGGADDDLISAENGHVVANLVATTQHAYDTLHACGYDVARALEAIRDNPVVSLDTPQHWTAEQVRRFYAAIKVHGKNFHAIHKDYFSPITAVDPITGIGGGAVVEALTSRNARGRKRRGNAQADAKIATTAVAELDTIKKDEEDDKPECDTKETMKNAETNDGEIEDEETEDVKDGEGEICRSTRTLFQPTREKTVKQLVTFYYYWKRKSTSNITSAAAHAAAVAAAAAAAAVNTGTPFRGSTVEANFNRGFAATKKRKTGIIECSDSTVMNSNNPPESENDETGVDTPRTDLAASPADMAAVVTDVIDEGEEPSKTSEDSTEVVRLCRNCCAEPIESPSPLSTMTQKHHQAGVERPLVTHVCAKCRMHWRKYGEVPKFPPDKSTIPPVEQVEGQEEEEELEVKADKTSGEKATRIEAAASTAQQLQDGVTSVENHRKKSMLANATKMARMSGVEEATSEMPPDSVCSFCDAYSPTYASCWPSPLLKLDGASSDSKLYFTTAPPSTDPITIRSVSPPSGDQRPIAVTPEPVSVGDASTLIEARAGVASTPCSSGIHMSKYSSLRNIWDRSIGLPSSLSSVSSASSEVQNLSSCARTDAEFMAATTASEAQPSQLASFQLPQPNPSASLPPLKRFTNYMASAAAAAADFGASGFNFPFDKEQMQILMQQYFSKTSEASQQLHQQQQQQQQQPMELTAKARAPPPPPPAVPPASPHLAMNEPSLLTSSKCFVPSVDQPLNLKGPIRATTHARGTFYPPTGVPPSGPTASMPRQQQQATAMLSMRSSNVSGGAGRYSSTSGGGLRPPPPPPPPPSPFGGGLGGRPSSSTASARFQCASGSSLAVAHSMEAIPTEPALINAFVKDQFIASSMARSGNFQQLQHHQQSQQQRSSIPATRAGGIPVESVEKMNQMLASFAAGGGQKGSTLPPSQKQQQQQHSRDAVMDVATAAALRSHTSIGEARNADVMHRYQMAYQQQQQQQQQQQWEQQMQQLQRFLQTVTPQQQQQVMMMLFSQIHHQQQQQQQQQQSHQHPPTPPNRLAQPPPTFHHHHQQHSSMPSSFAPPPPAPAPAPAPQSQYRMQNSGGYSQQSQQKTRIPPTPSLASSSSTSSLATAATAVTAPTSVSSSVLSNSNSGFHRNPSVFLSQQQQQQQQELQPSPQMQPSPWSMDYYSNLANFSPKLAQMSQLSQFLKLYDAPNPAIVAAAIAAAANAVDSTPLRHQQHQHLQQQEQQQQHQHQHHLRAGANSSSSTQPLPPPPPPPAPPPPLQPSVSASASSRAVMALQESEALSELLRLMAQHHSPQSNSGHHHRHHHQHQQQ